MPPAGSRYYANSASSCFHSVSGKQVDMARAGKRPVGCSLASLSASLVARLHGVVRADDFEWLGSASTIQNFHDLLGALFATEAHRATSGR